MMVVQDQETGLQGAGLFDRDEVEGVLAGSFYAPPPILKPATSKKITLPGDKPTHYKVICISMYTEDLAQLDRLVGTLKERGLTKANRSSLIRAALDQIDLDKVPRGI
jgi:hypothetical protein